MSHSTMSALQEKIRNKEAKIGVLGLGYVGLPLALEFARSGYLTYGIDVSRDKVEKLQKGNSYIKGIDDKEVGAGLAGGKFIPTADTEVIAELDAISICVPTPLTADQLPDMSYIISALDMIKANMHSGLLIVLESTTYPGTTEEIIQAQLDDLGYEAGVDYFLCFSPERVDPGNEKYNTKNTPKVIGGTTKACTEIGVALYSGVIDQIVPVSSPKTAEMSKLLENTFRSINIAFINEMAMLSDSLGIDLWETIEAASTKPFGFMPFYPGPGIGGHCIPLDPMYLSYKAKNNNFNSRFIEHAQEVNKNMPRYVVGKAAEALNRDRKSINGSRILLLGMAYKPDVDDIRESPALEVYELFKRNGAEVQYNDPYAQSFNRKDGRTVYSAPADGSGLAAYDCVVLLTNHSVYDTEMIHRYAKLIVDTRNAFKGYNSSKIFTIGSPTDKPDFVFD